MAVLDFRWTELGWKQWLLAQRSLTDPTELAYYFVFAPNGDLHVLPGVLWIFHCYVIRKTAIYLSTRHSEILRL